jgi:hypothetical protein
MCVLIHQRSGGPSSPEFLILSEAQNPQAGDVILYWRIQGEMNRGVNTTRGVLCDDSLLRRRGQPFRVGSLSRSRAVFYREIHTYRLVAMDI